MLVVGLIFRPYNMTILFFCAVSEVYPQYYKTNILLRQERDYKFPRGTCLQTLLPSNSWARAGHRGRYHGLDELHFTATIFKWKSKSGHCQRNLPHFHYVDQMLSQSARLFVLFHAKITLLWQVSLQNNTVGLNMNSVSSSKEHYAEQWVTSIEVIFNKLE